MPSSCSSRRIRLTCRRTPYGRPGLPFDHFTPGGDRQVAAGEQGKIVAGFDAAADGAQVATGVQLISDRKYVGRHVIERLQFFPC